MCTWSCRPGQSLLTLPSLCGALNVTAGCRARFATLSLWRVYPSDSIALRCGAPEFRRAHINMHSFTPQRRMNEMKLLRCIGVIGLLLASGLAFADLGPPIKAGDPARAYDVVGPDQTGGPVPIQDVQVSIQGPGTVSVSENQRQIVYLPPAYVAEQTLVEINVQGKSNGVDVYGQTQFYLSTGTAVRIDLVIVQ
jgi:hypothetical protein